MPEEEKKEEKKPKKAPPKGPLVIILSIIIGLILASVVSIIVATKVVKETEIPEPPIDEEEEPLPEEKFHYFEIGGFLAKIIAEEPTYAKIEKLTLMYDARYELLLEELENRKSQIRDIINTLLISQTPEIGTKEGKEAFKDQILKEINTILRDGQIEDVFCEILLQ